MKNEIINKLIRSIIIVIIAIIVGAVSAFIAMIIAAAAGMDNVGIVIRDGVDTIQDRSEVIGFWVGVLVFVYVLYKGLKSLYSGDYESR